jgi:hypothetical protein
MAGQQKQWRRAGWGVYASTGLSCKLYRALVPLGCYGCGRLIQPGERFTQPLLSLDTYLRPQVCWDCRPFHDEPDERNPLVVVRSDSG